MDEDELYSDDEQAGERRVKRQKGQPTITDMAFMKSSSTKAAAKPTVPEDQRKTMEEASKQVMNSLLSSYDNPAEVNDLFTEKAAFNKDQEYELMYGNVMPNHSAPPTKEPPPEPMSDIREQNPEPVLESVPEAIPESTSKYKRTQEQFEKKLPPQSISEPVLEADDTYKESVERFKVDSIDILKKAQNESLTGNADGSLDFFWVDAFEEPNNHEAIYLVGKVPVGNKYSTCCVSVKGIERCLYFVPKRLANMKPSDDSEFPKMFEEIEKIRSKQYSSIKAWRLKTVLRNYSFELPLLHGENKFLKVKYLYKYPALPSTLTGETFACVIGTTTGMLENFIVKRKLWGPSWLKLKKYSVPTRKLSWCRFEVVVEKPKDVIVGAEELRRPMPPLNVLSLAIKHYTDKKSGKNAISVITGVLDENVSIEKPTVIDRVNPVRFSLICPYNNKPLPGDLLRQAQSSRVNVTALDNEKSMLVTFLNKITHLDPDIITGHDLYGYTLDLVISRMRNFNITSISQIGRLKAASLPKAYSSYQCRIATIGRLLCDTFMSAKDMLPREADYTLPHLAKKQLNENLEEFDHNMLAELLQTSSKALQVVRHTEREALVSLKITYKLAVLPLTKQLANIAGHLWIRSLQNARAERNEMLLMHEFHDKKYLIPDKVVPAAKKRPLGGEMMDENEEEKSVKKTKKKAAYEGGLVLEPKSGFYDRYVLLLDFQSLYPSIIQEFNICFTTVKRSSSQKLPGKGAAEIIPDEIGKLPPEEVKRGILPAILENLVSQRRKVKKQMASARDPVAKQQYDIKQRAIKLSANSMYGCLGFTNSRFYAKPIAALITKKGRDTLQSAYNVAAKELNLQVIYGDTDSLMVNSNKDSITEALEIARKLRGEINKTYSKLEIEIDGVFKCLLLLKKKKYAALKLRNPESEKDGTTIDIKGLDMVRRDWCQLTKILSDEVLKELMSGKNSEEVAAALNKKFADYGRRLQEGKIRLSQFIITKQLTKSLSEYKDAQRQPHVRVAQGMIYKGESESNLIGHFIPYVICKGPQGMTFAERAHHPSDVQTLNLEIDTVWYATQQILPPLQRLLEYLKEFNLDNLPMHFGLDPKEHRIYRQQ
eukprot:TRINITY_DN11050_c0_g1_i1.p1 TRINITY_DN11050_c0_g1~~TRINITY_DN11050_c0_g1_i1.p1  ORF type:complete len:1109 (-),score=401.44 TRINITY_DN11050_c0_g1_i1:2846-6172(-)